MMIVIKQILFGIILFSLMLSADIFPSIDLNFSGLSSLSKMGEQLDHLVETEKKLDKLPVAFKELNNSKNNSQRESLRPYLNRGTKDLEKKYPWLYEKMEEMLLNEENIEAYALESAYFQYLDDLNDDGIAEVFLYNSSRCGSGGCNFKIYQIDTQNKRLNLLFDAYDNFEGKSTSILSTKHHGWKDINVTKCYGAMHCQNSIVEYHNKVLGYGSYAEKVSKEIK